MTDCQKIKLVFATTAGDLEDSFHADQKLRDVKRVVMARLKLDACQADQFVVTLIGDLLDEGETLDALDLSDCLVLTIERKEVVKI
jgi:hypothetical protein